MRQVIIKKAWIAYISTRFRYHIKRCLKLTPAFFFIKKTKFNYFIAFSLKKYKTGIDREFHLLDGPYILKALLKDPLRPVLWRKVVPVKVIMD